jgi:uncharacterized protein with HEPN domain
MKIQKYVEEMDFDVFQKDEKTIDAVIRNFIVIGEAARHVPGDVSDKFPNIPWRVMGDMRNFAVHEYWGVELRTIWKTIQEDLPPLVPGLKQVIDSEKDKADSE